MAVWGVLAQLRALFSCLSRLEGQIPRAELARRVTGEELKVLREALEDRLQAVALRSWQERDQEEGLAAWRRKDGQGPLPCIRGGGAKPRTGVCSR